MAEALNELGLSAWTDADLRPGENWSLAIGQAIQQADAIVFLLSPAAVASEWVQREIEHAIVSPRFKDRLVPVKIKPITRIPPILTLFNVIDATRNVRQTAAKVAAAIGPRKNEESGD